LAAEVGREKRREKREKRDEYKLAKRNIIIII